MSRKERFSPLITKNEFIHLLSEKTGFTLKNCSIFYDAFAATVGEVLMSNRSIPLKKCGRIEPYIKPSRKLYKLDKDTGIKLDENGEKMSYTIPDTRWIKFVMTQKFKCKMNPEVYVDKYPDKN